MKTAIVLLLVGFLEALWDFFSSMKTAIVLLLILAASSIAGTIIPQGAMPEEMARHYGNFAYKLIHALALDDMYDSWWYVSLLILVGINLAVCSVNRFRGTWQRMVSPTVVASAKQVSGMQRSESMSVRKSVSEASDIAETALRSSSYHVLKAQDGDDAVLYAAKGRLSIWGPYLTHLSILIVFLGAIAGSRLGYNGVTLVKEGGYTDSCYIRGTGDSKPLGFRVNLRSFKIGHDRNHNPTSYRSDLQVVDGGKTVAQKVIDVNQPLTYKGVSFYQTDYGLDSIVIKVTGPNGESRRIKFRVGTEEGPGGKQYSISGNSGEMAFEQVMIGGKKLTVFAHDLVPDYIGGEAVNATDMPLNPAANIMVNDRLPEYKGIDAWMKLGWLDASKPARFKGYTIALEDTVDYSILQVAKNPGLPVVYTGFGLLLLGVFVSFYITRKVIRVRVSPSKNGASVLIGGNSRSDPSVFDTEFERLMGNLTN